MYLFSAATCSLRHNANYVIDWRAIACKERNLHCDLHVTAEKQTHIKEEPKLSLVTNI